ncbi:ammonium transporter [Campylobacter fetus]|uniref:ammonium transporter n=1 Tax=Campylobacter fetus TaxID=196 RepID=UPI000FCB4BC8|nr:ammonium transporter [Campylobacter fetus]QQF51401.1 ammonium transporter [Campylobacter fetus subsp. venerealis]RUT49055.1 ammonia channel protein [Campylobacter fetus]RUT49219.1 ammonia channel protein [Campylobacter fetus]
MKKYLLLISFAAQLFSSDWTVSFDKIDSGNTAWLLTSTALVLFMTIPGIALFYAGMIRKKNILATMMQSFTTVAIVSVLWMAVGYSIAFTSGNPFIGGFDRLFLDGVSVISSEQTLTVHPNASSVPESVFIVFQMTFAIISCAIITGSFAERIKFSSLMIFIAIWVLVVYAPTAHWVWESNGWLANHGVLDYAGGTVVHINAGIAGLVGAIILKPRLGYKKEAMPPHNLVLTLIGVAMLWFGWFGFNAGSAVAADARAAMAMLATQVATAVGAITWLFFEMIHKSKPSALGFASGAVCGLVGITPAAGYVNASGALAIGIITSGICYYAVTVVKRKLNYDDSLDAFGIHGIGGIIGAILTAVFCDESISAASASVKVQIVGVAITVVYSGIVSYIILKIIDKTIGLRVSKDEEREGLDIASHGERLG